DEVWARVADTQEKLSQTVGDPVQAPESGSSLQLTLENRKVEASAGPYLRQLVPALEGKKDVIGYAVGINGKVNSAEVYASQALSGKLWPKLLRATAVEALTELRPGARFESPAAAAVRACLTEVEKGTATEQEVTPRVGLVLQETNSNLLFETR